MIRFIANAEPITYEFNREKRLQKETKMMFRRSDFFAKSKIVTLRIAVVVGITLLLLPFSVSARQDESTDQSSTAVNESLEATERLFVLKILPLIELKCLGCHGADEDDLRGDLDLRTRDAMIRGGESGWPTIEPGDADGSVMMEAIRWEGYEMPPKETDRLTDEEIAWFEQWINAGAPWPSESRQVEIQQAEWAVFENEDGRLVTTSGGLSDDWTYRRYDTGDIWAFQPLVTTDMGDSNLNPVDFLVRAKLAEHNLTPAPKASPTELIRRATYDLTGLPPTFEEIIEFNSAYEANPEQAWSELVDRLLASPHYGERWAQHWLDVVRYADTAGFSNDYERSNAWRYRDYVIRALNDDKPFDDFVREQIAGDEWKPEDAEAQIATGFLRMGPWGTAMVLKDEARQLYLDDVVHSVGQTFLAMPMRCCKCHDHKFDPIPTRDYYRMYAVFAATQPAEMDAAFLPDENRERFDSDRELVEELLSFARSEVARLVEIREAAAKAWYDERGLPYKNLEERRNDADDQKPERHCGLTPSQQGELKVREQDVWIWNRRLERYQPLAQSIYNGPDRHQNSRRLRAPGNVEALADSEQTHFIYLGGDLTATDASVTPGVLSACGNPSPVGSDDDPWQVPSSINGRRLAFAEWLVDRNNPLTARTFVNRIWQGHFGSGIVDTPNNFGVGGSRPSNRALLDFLAADLMDHGWQLKRIHRLIMMSETYQQSTQHPNREHLDATDPDNRYLARFSVRRLSAEEYRDSQLAVSGELNRQLGGLPAMPEINREIAMEPRMIQFSLAPAYQPGRTPEERNRRSIYAYRVRGMANPFLQVLNQPNPNESCEARPNSLVTPQAFTLLNSQNAIDRSIAFANRLIADVPASADSSDHETDVIEQRIERAFELAFGRKASEVERDRLAAYYVDMLTYHEDHPPEPIVNPTEITRSLVEEFTGEDFEYQEILPVYRDYVEDAKPWTVDASTRALADICRLIYNSNEFSYVY